MISKKLATFFEAKFTKTEGCWLWQGATIPRGYGMMYSEGKNLYAHRISYDLYVYPDFPKELHVLHKCDNPSCVNPAHLFLGTNQDNNDDCRSKGRNLSGENAHNSVLSDLEMWQVYDLALYGPYRQKEISVIYGIRPSSVSNIKAGRGRMKGLLQQAKSRF